MKYLLIVLMLSSPFAVAGGLGEYSNGWRMGQITKASVKGFAFKSLEAQMLVGSESTSLVKWFKDADGNSYKKVINPWYFSSPNTSMMKTLRPYIGEYAVIRYKQYHFKNVNVNTDYEVLEVEPIAKPRSEGCTAEKYIEGGKSDGVRVGRIVKASTKGALVNSYELIVQQGNSGNQFKSMSISQDKKLFECAVAFLKAGQKVKVHYSQSHLNLSMSRNTSYDIVKIEPTKGLN